MQYFFTSLAMTDHYTRAAIPEMAEAVKPAVEAANKLFEQKIVQSDI